MTYSRFMAGLKEGLRSRSTARCSPTSRAGQAGLQPDRRAGEVEPRRLTRREKSGMGALREPPFHFRPAHPCNPIDKIVADAQAAFDSAASSGRPRAGEIALPRQVGALTELLKGLGKLSRRAPEGGRGHQRGEGARGGAACGASRGDPRAGARPAPGRRVDRT